MGGTAFNTVILIGNLLNDFQVEYSSRGTPWAKFGLTTWQIDNDDKTARREPVVHWVTVFGEQAGRSAKYLHRGDLVFVRGRLSYDTFNDYEGNRRFAVNIIADWVTGYGPREEKGDNPV